MIVTDELVTEVERENFVRDGFFCVQRVSPPSEVAMIRGELMRLLTNKTGVAEGAMTDLVSPDGEPSVAPQMMNPSTFAPALRKTQHRANCMAIARAILGPSAKLAFEQMIYKPAGKGAGTPWHQDDAFTQDAEVEVAQISIWMPLQDVAEENGCMRYVAGSHLGPLFDHRSPNNDPRVHALEAVVDPDTLTPTYVPLPAGACVIHHSRTLHGSAPNFSANERMAYILAFDGPPRRREKPQNFHWHEGRRAERFTKYREWLMRGGVFLLIWRKLREGRFNDPRRIVYKIRTMMRRKRSAKE